MNQHATIARDVAGIRRLGTPVKGLAHDIGTGFTAKHFSEEMFGGSMDPLLMVDHFVMTGPTFAPHLHAGISAVTMMFEDAEGGFLNRDTLGNTVTLEAGDLYWLAAASGAAHEETPKPGARVHALQIFVNLPARLKAAPARAIHVRAGEVPVIQGNDHRVRVLLGTSGSVEGAGGTPEEMTMLDGAIDRGGSFTHDLPEGRQAWVYVVTGNAAVWSGSEVQQIEAGSGVAIEAGSATDVVIDAAEDTHFVLMAARPIHERFVKHGPLVMSTADDVRRTLADYADGKFGRVPA
jgi:redox-sensitive bicupin YhaK (pirin superfamily)